jgi:hypothetical protein
MNVRRPIKRTYEHGRTVRLVCLYQYSQSVQALDSNYVGCYYRTVGSKQFEVRRRTGTYSY